jgi:hypothetical protein
MSRTHSPLVVDAPIASRSSAFKPILRAITVYGPPVVVMTSVLAFGATVPWALLFLRLSAGALLISWAFLRVLEGKLDLRFNPLYLPVFAALILAGLQLAFNTTAYGYATEAELLNCIAYATIFFVASESWRSASDRHRILYSLATFGFFLALFAVIQGFSSNGKIYWTITPEFGGAVYGPYVNRNHFAGIMELLAPVAFVLAALHRRTMEKRALLIFAGILMGVSIITSQSRAGMISFAIEMLVLCALLFRTLNFRRFGPALLFAIFGFGAFVIWFGGGDLFQRFIGLSDYLRVSVVKDARVMISERPVFGWGLGTFPDVYPHFRTFYTNHFVNQAHDDIVQYVIEMGILGAAFASWFVFALYRSALCVVSNWTGATREAAPLAGFIGCTGLLFHSLFDFNLHIPANAAAFFLFAALATSGGERARDHLSTN